MSDGDRIPNYKNSVSDHSSLNLVVQRPRRFADKYADLAWFDVNMLAGLQLEFALPVLREFRVEELSVVDSLELYFHIWADGLYVCDDGLNRFGTVSLAKNLHLMRTGVSDGG